MELIRVLIADEQPHFRGGLRALLVRSSGGEPTCQCMGEGGSGGQESFCTAL
jgi:DNA-binding NarL/FixJ family response regulator